MAQTVLTADDRRRFARARERGGHDARAMDALAKAMCNETVDAIELVFRGGTTVTIPCAQIPALAVVPKRDLGKLREDVVLVLWHEQCNEHIHVEKRDHQVSN